MADYTPEVKSILGQNGCYFVKHGKGDHDKWYSPITNRTFPVDSKIKGRHMADEVLKQAGIGKMFIKAAKGK